MSACIHTHTLSSASVHMALGSHLVTQHEVRDTTEALIFLRVTLRDTNLSCIGGGNEVLVQQPESSFTKRTSLPLSVTLPQRGRSSHRRRRALKGAKGPVPM